MIRTVMVVEDDDAIRMVLRTNLEDEGYRVLEATTAEQGLLIVQDEQPDVVLVDLRLPVKRTNRTYLCRSLLFVSCSTCPRL